MIYARTSGKVTGADLDLTNVQESYEYGIERACAIVAESEMNYNKIMQAVGVAEATAVAETGAEMVYEASDISGFFAKVKEFFQKLIEKIKSLFKKFFGMLDSWIKSDKDFVNKYKSDLVKADTRNFEFKGYTFTNLGFDIGAAGVKVMDTGVDKLKINLNSLDKSNPEEVFRAYEDKEDVLEEARGAAIGKGALSSSDFHKELFEYFRNGESEKETIDKINVTDLMSELVNAKTAKTQATKDYNNVVKFFKELIKDTDNIEKEALKVATNKDTADDKKESESKIVRVASIASEMLKEASSIVTIVNGAKMTALKDNNRQAKAVCVKLLTYKPKNEGTEYQNYDGSILGGVTLK